MSRRRASSHDPPRRSLGSGCNRRFLPRHHPSSSWGFNVTRLFAFGQHLTDKPNVGIDESGARTGDTPNIVIDAGTAKLAALFAAASDMLSALREAQSALSSVMEQLSQCSGMFDDEDGAVAAAMEEGEAADEAISAAIAKAEGRAND